jgi:hypothetical protein
MGVLWDKLITQGSSYYLRLFTISTYHLHWFKLLKLHRYLSLGRSILAQSDCWQHDMDSLTLSLEDGDCDEQVPSAIHGSLRGFTSVV